MKKAFLSVLSILFLCACSSNPSTSESSSSSKPAKKEVDMILVAGQSNAAGYSPIQSNQTETYLNVTYAGETDRTLRGDTMTIGSDYLSSPSKYVHGVRGGLGYSNEHIGPEYGIAKALNDDYVGDKELVIAKTAAGGTTLSDVDSNLSGVYGNWYPRSLWNDGYEPNIDEASKNNPATGLLYKLLVENFTKVFNTYKKDGYSINVLGVCWMQGESDADLGSGYVYNYGKLLTAFIKDLRLDVAELTGLTEDEEGLPFVIGKIAPTYYGYNRSINFSIREKQEEVATALEGVDTVETDDLIVVQKDGSYNEGCVDPWHFNFKDMVTFGGRFAEKIKELNR